MPHKILRDPIYCGDGEETHAVTLLPNGTEIHVYNMYRAQSFELDLSELFVLATEISIIVGGDFKSNHELLGSMSTTDETGRHLAILLEEMNGVTLLNERDPTHVQGIPFNQTVIIPLGSRSYMVGSSDPRKRPLCHCNGI